MQKATPAASSRSVQVKISRIGKKARNKTRPANRNSPTPRRLTIAFMLIKNDDVLSIRLCQDLITSFARFFLFQINAKKTQKGSGSTPPAWSAPCDRAIVGSGWKVELAGAGADAASARSKAAGAFRDEGARQ
jgi:hypothetical protein